MPSPFPGMDPYLEDRALWPAIHHDFISQITAHIAPQVAPAYIVRIEERVLTIGEDDPAVGILIPDVAIQEAGTLSRPKAGPAATAAPTATAPLFIQDEIREAYLEIRTLKGGRIVTVIELLSPSNKVVGSGIRNAYLDKRRRWFNCDAHFVEIDLLRGGDRISPVGIRLPPCEYRIVISTVKKRPLADFWQIRLRDPLPVIPIPLAGDDPPVALALKKILDEVYDRARYDLQVDYASDPPPPELSGEDKEWLRSFRQPQGKSQA